MRVKVITLFCISAGILALTSGKYIKKANDQLKDTDLKGEVDKEQSNNLIQQESESLGTKQESEEERKKKDPCVCSGKDQEESKKAVKKTCQSSCKENKKCRKTGKRSDCKSLRNRRQCKSEDNARKQRREIPNSDSQRKCNCKCTTGLGKDDARQVIPKPGQRGAGSVNPISAVVAQHGISKKVNSSKKCCCDCCDCCHDCCDCCHDCCCHDCCHCCEPCCCCCHCCEPCCCCCHCCEPCCHCCHCCHHCCPCCCGCCGCGCGCCKKSKSLLNNQALATAAALAANRPVHH